VLLPPLLALVLLSLPSGRVRLLWRTTTATTEDEEDPRANNNETSGWCCECDDACVRGASRWARNFVQLTLGCAVLLFNKKTFFY
jgi:hypothetical protein